MGKISAVFLARKKRSITFIVNYELRLSLYSNRVKGRGWNIYKFLVERKPAKRILWRHLKWRWKERKGRQETWLQLRPWDAITCNNTWRGKRSYGVNTFPDAKKEPNFFKKKKKKIVWQFKNWTWDFFQMKVEGWSMVSTWEDVNQMRAAKINLNKYDVKEPKDWLSHPAIVTATWFPRGGYFLANGDVPLYGVVILRLDWLMNGVTIS